MISILITCMREADTVGEGIKSLLKDFHQEYELLYSIPDAETEQALLKALQEIGAESSAKSTNLDLKGKAHGKPKELNHLMDMAAGDIWILCDPGDCTFGENVIPKLLASFKDEEVQAVTGKPISADGRKSMMAYFGSMLAEAAHHKRMIELRNEDAGYGTKLIKRRGFFPVSGYLFAMRATKDRAPEDTLVEDAFFSYKIHNRGGKIAYEPEAHVFVKYAKNLKDYFKQKKRSVGGYVQLWKYNVVKKETVSRSPRHELEYFWFPIKYAQSIKELVWSMAFYPIRLWLWIKIMWERKVVKKDFFSTWEQAESTK